FVVAIASAGRNDANGRTMRFHDADLHRGGLSSQQTAVVEVKGIREIARRMVRRSIQGVEVVKLVVDVRPFRDLKTQAEEDVFDPPSDDRDRMQGAALGIYPRQAQVLHARSILFFLASLFQ